MKINELAKILNALVEKGWGETEIKVAALDADGCGTVARISEIVADGKRGGGFIAFIGNDNDGWGLVRDGKICDDIDYPTEE